MSEQQEALRNLLQPLPIMTIEEARAAGLLPAAPAKRQEDAPKPRGNKHHAQAVEVGGLRFASKKEARRWGQLKLLEASGLITDLTPHPSFRLIVEGVDVGEYTADASYRQKSGLVVEDCKSPSTRTEAYKLRKRLMFALFKIDIVEI